MDAATLDNLKSSLRQLVTESIGDAITELKKHLPDFSSKYNALLLLESRLNDANLKNIQHIISDEALQIEYNQLRVDLLLFIGSLTLPDFELPQGASGHKSGALLYKIPHQMQLNKETKCLVRLAYDKPTIIRNLELTDDVVIRDVRVTEVMQVELIDPTSEHPFVIRSISDEEQFVEQDEYTEWVFYVQPVLAGTFPLVLKVSVVEVVQGKERVRNIVWEEQVQIVATAPQQAEPEVFKSTGLVIDGNATPAAHDTAGAEAFEPSDLIQPAPQVMPPPVPVRDIEVLPKQMPKRRNTRTWLAAAASVLLIVTFAIFMLPTSSEPNVNEHEIRRPDNVVADSLAEEIMEDSLLRDSMRQEK